MRGTLIYGAHDVRFEERATPRLAGKLSAVVRVVATCVCGSDLWRFRGVADVPHPTPIGHEFVGVVEETGSEVRTLKPGDFVIAPFYCCDGTCVNCRDGFSSCCRELGWWDGAQSEYVAVPLADGSLKKVPGGRPDDALLPSLLTLSDVMGTGFHAALSAGVHAGSRAAVIGDGAVGLCAIIACRLLGAERIVAMSRHPDRQTLARAFGATDVVEERGDEGASRIRDMFDGVGADASLECVGSQESMDQALASTRPGGTVGFVGVPASGPAIPVRTLFSSNVGVRGGVAPVWNYVDRLLPEVLAGRIEPGRVFTRTRPLSEVAHAYADMDARREIKVMLRP